MSPLRVERLVRAVETVEGAGFPIRRPFPTAELPTVDPFLMLDHVGPVDWPPGAALGAPDHPHRGFETISYVLEGEKVHRDSRGGHGVLGPGDVQWMTAGAGIVHSEMPSERFRARGGVAHGFQIWVNLPSALKLCEPRYQDVPRDRIPAAATADGLVEVKVIAGEALGQSAVIDTHTPVTFLHFRLRPGGHVVQPIPAGDNACLYVLRGEALAGDPSTPVPEGYLTLFERAAREREPGTVVIESGEAGGECLLLAGTPLDEPIARMGPFVMNRPEEIHQAIADYQAGRMGRIPARSAAVAARSTAPESSSTTP